MLNIFIPGAGTLYGGRTLEGALQIVLLVVGLLTTPFLFGFAILGGLWAWAVVDGIQIARESNRPRKPAHPEPPPAE